jgi:hypothetical protein
MPRPSRASTGTHVLALALASGVIASACGGSTPAGSPANGAIATAGATVDGAPTPGSIAIDVPEHEAQARADPSLERQVSGTC